MLYARREPQRSTAACLQTADTIASTFRPFFRCQHCIRVMARMDAVSSRSMLEADH